MRFNPLQHRLNAGAEAGLEEGYYTDAGEKPGRWVAAGAMNVGDGVEATTEALRAALSCVDPGSGAEAK